MLFHLVMIWVRSPYDQIFFQLNNLIYFKYYLFSGTLLLETFQYPTSTLSNWPTLVSLVVQTTNIRIIKPPRESSLSSGWHLNRSTFVGSPPHLMFGCSVCVVGRFLCTVSNHSKVSPTRRLSGKSKTGNGYSYRRIAR